MSVHQLINRYAQMVKVFPTKQMIRKSVYITDYFDIAMDEDTYIKIRFGVAARPVRSSRPHRSMKSVFPNPNKC